MRSILTVVLLLSVFLSGCTTVRYYGQSIKGQLQLLSKSTSIKKLLSQAETPEELKTRLRLVQSIRNFAFEQLALPVNDSYTGYVDLQRPYVVWNLFAAPELSLVPYQWCYPIIGCQSYRGFFNQIDAQRYMIKMKKRAYDVSIEGVSAYSTLGWFNDPVLNSFINYSDANLAGLLFHELSHHVVYVKGDTVFNESFATMVELEGLDRWLQANNDQLALDIQRRYRRFNQDVVGLILGIKQQLQKEYGSNASQEDKRKIKQRLFRNLKASYSKLRSDFELNSGWDAWFKQDLNNASLVSIDAYHEKIDEFEVLFKASERDFKSFYKQVKALSSLSKSERNAALKKIKKQPPMQSEF